MKAWFILGVLGCICSYMQICRAQCDLAKARFDVPFPNIEDEGIESYQMSVEYTAPGANQTDYYTEYYDMLYRRGRIESHQSGKSSTYIYRTSTWEAWTITRRNCTLQNITDIPDLLKNDQNNWIFEVPNNPELRTMGPSAMFKRAFGVWNTSQTGKIGYRGVVDNVRGMKAVVWRWCDSTTNTDSYVDFFFTADEVENALGMKNLKRIPLRVVYGGTRPAKLDALAVQQYEIMSFQPFISLDIKPFQLPKYLRCRRGPNAKDDAPDLPDFTSKNLLFSAEVIYRIIDWESRNDVKVWSYYSTLTMALDVSTQHIAYHYTPWNSTKPKDDNQEPIANAPEFIIYDMKHGYAYKTNVETGKCDIIRESSFVPSYDLPGGAGSISLTDPAVLFPNDELSFVTEGKNRGLDVNVFEGVFKNYILDTKGSKVQIPEVFVSHSYLKDDVVEENTVSVQNALTQVQLTMRGRYEKQQAVEVVTFNFFGFTTELRERRYLFNVKRCYKNDDDYLWVTIGFNADQSVLQKIKDDVPAIQSNVMGSITLQSELNAVRMPVILVDIKDALYVTILVLGKPPLQLDYLAAESDTTISNTKEAQGVSTFEDCAQACLETENNCWGFSLCGDKEVKDKGVCYFGIGESAKATKQAGCSLYRRFHNTTFMPSKELAVQNVRRAVETGQLKLMLPVKDSDMVQLDASSVTVTQPSEDDSLFDKMGNVLDPRMKVVKAGAKLKIGNALKNLGKLRYDECQRVCLDFKDCETVSYCLKGSECLISTKYYDDLGSGDTEANNLCNLLGRKYGDHFERSPGIVLSEKAAAVLNKPNLEDCARACMKETKFKCLSFDHCPVDNNGACRLHTVYYPNPKTKEDVKTKSTNCGHYFRKYSSVFKKNPEKRSVGSQVPPLMNLTLEECSKTCMEYGKGTCFGFDFCQDTNILATSCILIDKDPTGLKTVYNPICTNYMRPEAQYAARPYTNAYAGGIGFLCFLVGGLIGAAIVFVIAYMRVNRR